MDSTPSTSTIQTSSAETTPESDSGTSRTTISGTYTKSSKSSSLQAFHTFEESLAHFHSHVLSRIDDVGHGNADTTKLLEILDTKCEQMKKEFAGLISRLDKAIQHYEEKKPTDLPPDVSSVISPEKPARNRSSLFKGNQTVKEMFDVLNHGIVNLHVAIGKKIHTSIYEDYSFSMDKKLKNLKRMCEDINNKLEQIGKMVKNAIEANDTSNDGNDES